MTILIDMDDTIESLLKAWVSGVNRKYGRSVSYEDVDSWDVSAAFPGLTHEQVYAVPLEKGLVLVGIIGPKTQSANKPTV